MRGNIVIAAAVAGGAVIVASIIFVVGIAMALDRSANHLADAIHRHANQTTAAGSSAGAPIAAALSQMREAHARHAEAVIAAGKIMSQPNVTMQSPVPIVDEQPLRIQGTVGVELGENKESKEKKGEK